MTNEHTLTNVVHYCQFPLRKPFNSQSKDLLLTASTSKHFKNVTYIIKNIHFLVNDFKNIC